MTTWLLTQPGLIVQAIGLDSQNLSRTMQVPAPVLSVHAHRALQKFPDGLSGQQLKSIDARCRVELVVPHPFGRARVGHVQLDELGHSGVFQHIRRTWRRSNDATVGVTADLGRAVLSSQSADSRGRQAASGASSTSWARGLISTLGSRLLHGLEGPNGLQDAALFSFIDAEKAAAFVDRFACGLIIGRKPLASVT